MNMNLPIPTDVEQITSEWLTQALRSTETITTTKVKSLQIEKLGKGAGIVGRLARFNLDYTQPEKEAPESIAVKFACADLQECKNRAGIYEREVRIYQELTLG